MLATKFANINSLQVSTHKNKQIETQEDKQQNISPNFQFPQRWSVKHQKRENKSQTAKLLKQILGKIIAVIWKNNRGDKKTDQ